MGPAGLAASTLGLALVVGYAWADHYITRRAPRRGHHYARTASFAGGIVALWIATGSGLAALDGTNETAHVVQHLLLMMVGPALVAAGRPLSLVCQAAPRCLQVRIVRALRGTTVSTLTSPWVSWPLYSAAMFTYWLVQPIYNATLQHPLLHEASHTAIFVIGFLYWEPLVGDGVGFGRRRSAHPVRMIGVLVSMPLDLLLGLSLTLLSHPLDPVASLAANREAGQVFWIVSMLFSGLVVLAMALEWLAVSERASAGRQDPASLADPLAWTEVPWAAGAPAAGSRGVSLTAVGNRATRT